MEFQDIIRELEDTGVYDVALPFLLIYTIVFAVLQKIELFGKGKSHKYNMVIALVTAFLFIRNEEFIDMMQQFIPNLSMALMVIFGVLLIFSWSYGSYKELPKLVAISISVFAIFWAFFSATGIGQHDLPYWLYYLSEYDIEFFIILGIFTIIFVVYSPERKTKKNKKDEEEDEDED